MGEVPPSNDIFVSVVDVLDLGQVLVDHRSVFALSFRHLKSTPPSRGLYGTDVTFPR
jgi:hypothetical protein